MDLTEKMLAAAQEKARYYDLCYEDETVIDFITNGYYNLNITVMPDGMLIIRL